MLTTALRNIRQKPNQEIYYATEAAFYYEFDKERLDAFITFHKEKGGLLADWYRTLNETEKKKVIKKLRFE